MGTQFGESEGGTISQRQFRSDDTSIWSDKYGNGSDGAYAPSTGTDAPIDSACTGTINTTSLSATNVSFATGQLILIHQSRGTGAGQWELNKIAGYTAGTITTSYNLIYDYVSGAQVLVMPQYASANIAGGVTITGKAWDGTVGGIYAKFVNGTFTLAGTLTVKGADGGQNNSSANSDGGGYRGGHGSNDSPNQAGQGESEVGAGGNSVNANGSGGGGGQGGAGGGTVGTSYQTVAGLTTRFVFGGAGGGANGNGGTGAQGGNGGGIVLIIAKTITVSGSLNVNGGAGNNGTVNGGSGGGAGGCVLLKGQVLTLGTTLCTSSGGNGGSSVGGDPGGGGAGSANGSTKNGAVGRIHADYSKSISGTTTPSIDSRSDLVLNTDTGMLLVF